MLPSHRANDFRWSLPVNRKQLKLSQNDKSQHLSPRQVHVSHAASGRWNRARPCESVVSVPILATEPSEFCWKRPRCQAFLLEAGRYGHQSNLCWGSPKSPPVLKIPRYTAKTRQDMTRHRQFDPSTSLIFHLKAICRLLVWQTVNGDEDRGVPPQSFTGNASSWGQQLRSGQLSKSCIGWGAGLGKSLENTLGQQMWDKLLVCTSWDLWVLTVFTFTPLSSSWEYLED